MTGSKLGDLQKITNKYWTEEAQYAYFSGNSFLKNLKRQLKYQGIYGWKLNDTVYVAAESEVERWRTVNLDRRLCDLPPLTIEVDEEKAGQVQWEIGKHLPSTQYASSYMPPEVKGAFTPKAEFFQDIYGRQEYEEWMSGGKSIRVPLSGSRIESQHMTAGVAAGNMVRKIEDKIQDAGRAMVERLSQDFYGEGDQI